MDKKIENGIKDQKILDGLQTPCSVFATFETEEGVTRAFLYNELVNDEKLGFPTYYKEILGKPIDIQEASEPTDIIWENRMFTPFHRCMKRIVVVFVILIALMISASLIFSFS